MKNKILILCLLLTQLVSASIITKQARNNDIATKYQLNTRTGNLYRFVNGLKCQITNDVKSFKISIHRQDVAMIYFQRKGDLYMLKKNYGEFRQCPKAIKKVIMNNVKKYTVVPQDDTKVVNVALSYSGELVGWDHRSTIFRYYNIEKYSHNMCFAKRGKSFSSYLVFAKTHRDSILKIKGKNSLEMKEDTSRRYYSISEFKRQNRVCQ